MTNSPQHAITATRPNLWRCSCGYVAVSAALAQRHLEGPRPEHPNQTEEALRHAAIVWMLHEAGKTYREIGAAMGITAARAGQLGIKYERIVQRRIRRAREHCATEAWARRLFAAGAIR